MAGLVDLDLGDELAVYQVGRDVAAACMAENPNWVPPQLDRHGSAAGMLYDLGQIDQAEEFSHDSLFQLMKSAREATDDEGREPYAYLAGYLLGFSRPGDEAPEDEPPTPPEGLPVALVAMARGMRHGTEDAWRRS